MSLIVQKIKTITTRHFSLLKQADPDEDMINSYISRAFLYECLYNNKIVGILALAPTSDTTLEILNISVLESYQNQGIGSRLLGVAETFTKENHYSTLEVCTGSTSIWQLYFYQKNGFRLIDIHTDYFIDTYPTPIFEHGIQLKDQVRLQKKMTNQLDIR